MKPLKIIFSFLVLASIISGCSQTQKTATPNPHGMTWTKAKRTLPDQPEQFVPPSILRSWDVTPISGKEAEKTWLIEHAEHGHHFLSLSFTFEDKAYGMSPLENCLEFPKDGLKVTEVEISNGAIPKCRITDTKGRVWYVEVGRLEVTCYQVRLTRG